MPASGDGPASTESSSARSCLYLFCPEELDALLPLPLARTVIGEWGGPILADIEQRSGAQIRVLPPQSPMWAMAQSYELEGECMSTRTLFVGQIDASAVEEDVLRLFSRFGTVIDIDMKKKDGNTPRASGEQPWQMAFVAFADETSLRSSHSPGTRDPAIA